MGKEARVQRFHEHAVEYSEDPAHHVTGYHSFALPNYQLPSPSLFFWLILPRLVWRSAPQKLRVQIPVPNNKSLILISDRSYLTTGRPVTYENLTLLP